jgi:hypothetical protein
VVMGVVRPTRPQGTGVTWQSIAGQRELISQWLEQGLTLAKVHLLLGRGGVVVPLSHLAPLRINRAGVQSSAATHGTGS